MAKLLHKAIGLGNESRASEEAYKAYMQHFVDSPVAVLRDCLEFKEGAGAIPLDQVRPGSRSRFTPPCAPDLVLVPAC